MKKKNMSLFLACAMTMGMATSALAADEVKEKTYTAFGDENTTINSDVSLDGTIVEGEVLLSVVMPTSIDFVVGTTQFTGDVVAEKNVANASQSAGGFVFSALMSGEGTVTNNSNKPIKLELVGITDTSDLLKKMDLALKPGSVNEATALRSYALDNTDYSASPMILASSIAAEGGTTTLSVAGQAAMGQYSGLDKPVNLPAGSYSVNTTMKISVAR